MPEMRWVTKTQVMAARLAVKIAREDGRNPDPVLVKIAEAKPGRRPRKPRPRTDSATPS